MQLENLHRTNGSARQFSRATSALCTVGKSCLLNERERPRERFEDRPSYDKPVILSCCLGGGDSYKSGRAGPAQCRASNGGCCMAADIHAQRDALPQGDLISRITAPHSWYLQMQCLDDNECFLK